MERKEISYLKDWLKRRNRKPLIIRGARQTGKSTLVRLFAEEAGRRLIEVNFEENHRFKSIFADGDVDSLLASLEIQLDTRISADDSVLFLDEIQACPDAIARLRYFYERIPELPVLAAGSLLEFALAETAFSMPVGRIEFLWLGPMTFEEFLLGYGSEQLVQFLKNYAPGQDIPEPIHSRALQLLRSYMILGGMPEVVRTYLESGSFLEADRVRQGIVQTLRNDFNKYRGRQDIQNLHEVFDRLTTTVGKKIVYTSLLPGVRSYKAENALRLFEQAQLIQRVYHTSANGLPLKAGINRKKAKGIILDIGLCHTLNGLAMAVLDRQPEIFFVNEGELAEQLVGQQLLNGGINHARPEIYYWNREKYQSKAEVDYVLQHGTTILPIEVKSGQAGRLRSLHLFMEQKQLRRAVRFSARKPGIDTVTSSLPGKTYQYELMTLPLYLTEQLNRLLLAL
jgi:uncharacterized protein